MAKAPKAVGFPSDRLDMDMDMDMDRMDKLGWTGETREAAKTRSSMLDRQEDRKVGLGFFSLLSSTCLAFCTNHQS